MKRFLLITTALLLSLSAWTQDLDYYRELLPKSNNFKIVDSQVDSLGKTYLLISFKGEYIVPGTNGMTIKSPDNKFAFAVIFYRKHLACYQNVEIIGYSTEQSDCYVFPERLVKTESAIAVVGKKTNGNLYIKGRVGSSISKNEDTGLFFAYFRPGTVQSCGIYLYEAKHLNIFTIDDYRASETKIYSLKTYYSNNSEYFVFGGMYAGTIHMGATSISTGEDRTPFFAKVSISNNGTTYHNISLKQLRTIGSAIGVITDIAINNHSLVVVGFYCNGNIDMDPSSSNSYLSSNGYYSIFVGRYSRTSFSYMEKGKLSNNTYSVPFVFAEQDKNNNFYISYYVRSSHVVDLDFNDNSVMFSGSKNVVVKYDGFLNYIYHIFFPFHTDKKTKIGIDENNNLCVLSPFEGNQNFNPNGVATYYTAESWGEPNPVNYFLGRYSGNTGTLITGNTIHSKNPCDFFLSTSKFSDKISVIGAANKVDYNLGIGESIGSYSDQMYFVATYDPCASSSFDNSLSSKTLCEGTVLTSTSISVNGTGNDFRYRWYKDEELLQNGTFDEGLITHADENQLKITNITPEATGNYKLEVTSRCDIPRFTNEASFTVTPKTHITQEPIGQIVCEGEATSFTVDADNSPSYQWQVNNGSGGFVNMPGKTSATLSLSNVDLNMAGYQYRCKVTGQSSCNEVYSNAVNLGVKATPQIQAQPQSNTETCEGMPATISVVTDGAGLSYQWQVSTNNGSSFSNVNNGYYYSGTQTATLNIKHPSLAYNSRIYRCIVSVVAVLLLTKQVYQFKNRYS